MSSAKKDYMGKVFGLASFCCTSLKTETDQLPVISTCKLSGKEHIGQFALAVSQSTVVAPLAVEVMETNPAEVVSQRRDHHDPGRRAALQQPDQQRRQQEVPWPEGHIITPALLIRMWSWLTSEEENNTAVTPGKHEPNGALAGVGCGTLPLPRRNFCAKARMEQVSARSSSRTSTLASGYAARMLAAASSPLSTSRHAMITRAPERDRQAAAKL
ncbi:hypothetical protein FQN60_008580 [Etheostoma spectabile]|uniref:Uncharacterized protein n=1 Tax=Etheostoma spectabile TaxID=54343 RepID=A0A5J5CNB9_9PERO|nr:hypothetical protein FQN60_008580 [Etheostoma spectabile]